MIFKNRIDAAERLADKLKKYKGGKAIILAIPRGALQIGAVLAKKLSLPLDIVLTKKIGNPHNPELAVGAVSLEGESIDPQFSDVSKEYIASEIKEIRKKLKERSIKYRDKKTLPVVKDKIVIIVDDGVATGNTMLAAIDLVRKENPKKVIVAVSVGPLSTIEKIQQKADEVVCLHIPPPAPFFAIGPCYRNFEQVSDQEAIRLLKEANK